MYFSINQNNVGLLFTDSLTHLLSLYYLCASIFSRKYWSRKIVQTVKS